MGIRRPATRRVHGVGQQWPPSPLAGREGDLSIRVWWSWAVLGSVAVILGSTDIVVTSEDSPRVPAAEHQAQILARGDIPVDDEHDNAWPASHASLPSRCGPRHCPGGLRRRVRSGRSGRLRLGHRDAPDLGHRLPRQGQRLGRDGRRRQHQGVELGSVPHGHRNPHPSGVGTLALGATGAYNQYFATLGKNLVSDNEANTILRLGWEFNGNWFTWSVDNATDATNFVAYWRQIVTTMRAVPGQKFKFIWNPNGPSPTTYTPTRPIPATHTWTMSGPTSTTTSGHALHTRSRVGHQLTQQWGLGWLATSRPNTTSRLPSRNGPTSTDRRPRPRGRPLLRRQHGHWFVTNQVAFANVCPRLLHHLPQQPARRHLPQGPGQVQTGLRLINATRAAHFPNLAPSTSRADPCARCRTLIPGHRSRSRGTAPGRGARSSGGSPAVADVRRDC